MKMGKIFAVLMLTVFVAACNGGVEECRTDRDCDSGMRCVNGRCIFTAPDERPRPTTVGELSVDIDAPSSIMGEVGNTDSFKARISSEESLGRPVIIFSNFGPHLSSTNCEGSVTLGEIGPERDGVLDCSLRIRSEPSRDRTQEIEYELIWTGKMDVEVDGVEVMTPERFEMDTPRQRDASSSVSYGPASLSMKIENVPAKTGEQIPVVLEVNAHSTPSTGIRCVEVGGTCSHHIERLTIRMPSGFKISGLSGFATTRCGDDACWTKDRIRLSDGKYEEKFTLEIERFTGDIRRQTFIFSAEVEGLRFYQVDSFELNIEAPAE